VSQANPPPTVTAINRLAYILLVLLAVSIPLAGIFSLQVPGLSSPKRPVGLSAFDLLLWIAFVFVCLREMFFVKADPDIDPGGGWLRRGLKLFRGVSLAAPVLCLIILISGILWPKFFGGQVAYGASLKSLIKLAEYAVAVFVVVPGLLRAGGSRKAAETALVLGVLAAVITAWVQYCSSGPDVFVGGFFGESHGLGANRNALGVFLAVAVPFMVVRAFQVNGHLRFLYIGTSVLAIPLLASPAGMIGVAGGLLLAAVLLKRKQASLLIAGALALFSLCQLLPRHGISQAWASLAVTKTCPQTGDKLVAMRYVRLATEWRVLKSGTIKGNWRRSFGLGPGGYRRDGNNFKPLDMREREPGQTDNVKHFDILADEPGTFNMFGVFALELGLPGLLCFCWLFGCWMLRPLRRLKCSQEGGLALAVLAAITGGLLAAPFASLWIKGSGPLLAFLIAFLGSNTIKPVITNDNSPEEA
jgi:hypothetical protein